MTIQAIGTRFLPLYVRVPPDTMAAHTAAINNGVHKKMETPSMSRIGRWGRRGWLRGRLLDVRVAELADLGELAAEGSQVAGRQARRAGGRQLPPEARDQVGSGSVGTIAAR